MMQIEDGVSNRSGDIFKFGSLLKSGPHLQKKQKQLQRRTIASVAKRSGQLDRVSESLNPFFWVAKINP